MTGPVYPEALGEIGISCQTPGEHDRERIDNIIFTELVKGVLTEESRLFFNAVIRKMKDHGCDAVVLGCTEIPLLVNPDDCPHFQAAEPWAEPLGDYLERGKRSCPDGFNRAITALALFEGRLWLGYGDATRNLGTPALIEFRYFPRPEDPQAVAARVLAEGQGVRVSRRGTKGKQRRYNFFRITRRTTVLRSTNT